MLRKILFIIFTLSVLTFISCCPADAKTDDDSWQGPGFYMIGEGGSNVHYFSEDPKNPNITFIGGVNGGSSSGDNNINNKNKNYNKNTNVNSNNNFNKNTNINNNNNKNINNNKVSAAASVVANLNYYEARSLMESLQLGSSPMPLINNNKIFDFEKIPNIYGIEKYKYNWKDEVVSFKKIEWFWDFGSWFAFDWVRHKNVPAVLANEFSKIEKKEKYRFDVTCYDGQEGSGIHGGLVAGGMEHSGLATVTGGLMPGKNRSDYDPKCVIYIFETK